MGAFYNDNDPFVAKWLNNLISAGHLPRGIVDSRGVEFLEPEDLHGFGECHFFAGIGGWPLALQQAGGARGLRVWTGSCPCQPFSVAGRRKGFSDKRHLWPEWFRLINACRPDVVFGEQVSSPHALEWLEAVFDDMEGAGYTCGALDLCAASVGAPHIRQRLYWVAYAGGERRKGERVQLQQGGQGETCSKAPRGGSPSWVAGQNRECGTRRWGGSTDSWWGDSDWLLCRDGKWRPVEPGTFPLADGVPSRVGRLRAYGNAVVVPLASAFVRSFFAGLGALQD